MELSVEKPNEANDRVVVLCDIYLF